MAARKNLGRSRPSGGGVARPDGPSVLYSGRVAGQSGVVVERRFHPAGEYAFASPEHHLLSIHAGDPVELEQARGTGRPRKALVDKGSVGLVPAGRPGLWRHEDGADFVNVQIAGAFVARVAAEERGDDGPGRDGPELLDAYSRRDARAEGLGLLLLAELEAGAPTGRLYAESLATALAAHLARAYVARGPGPRAREDGSDGLGAVRLRRVFDYVEDNLRGEVSLGVLARVANLSPSHFLVGFRRSTGTTPHQYVIERRIERAAHLLAGGGKTAAEAALESGFYDQSHLTRHMRRLRGVTPGALARRQP